ncbi:transposase [Sorangium sp. So ce131]|uniref:transposase n=1 Tax=Sorangium sp. So ce131 TaxID=3133282 RepID=UPI003F5DA412
MAHRPWVLTFPFPWRRRLAQDGALFGVLTRIFVESVERFYEERAVRRGARGTVKSGAVTAVQRTSGDMRLNPHLHVVFLDGAYHEDGTELVWNELGHLRTREVGQVLEHAVGRMLRYLRRHGHLEIEHDVEEDDACAHGTPMRPVARSAPPGPRSFDPGPSHHDARGPTLFGLLRYASSRCDPASFTYAPTVRARRRSSQVTEPSSTRSGPP